MRAEDRFGWLDDEAAESLLRGASVDDVSSYRSPHADELADVLDSLAESHRPVEFAKELPGEAEALAAFRTAHIHRCRGAGESSRSRRGRRMTRLSGTPLHIGLAMMLAGFALGGVAVAASSGVLPVPFSKDGVQAPGASGGQPPAEPLDGEPGRETGTSDPSEKPNRLAPGDDSSASPAERDSRTDTGHDHRDVAGADRGNGDAGGDHPTGHPTDHPTTWPHEPAPGDDGTPSAPETWPPPSADPHTPDPSVVVALCRAYEGDRIERRKRLQLERVAGGPERVESYCEEHGDDNGGGGGTEGGDGSAGGVGIPEQPQEPDEPELPEDPDGSADGGGWGGTEGSGNASSGGTTAGRTGGAAGSGGAAGGAIEGPSDASNRPFHGDEVVRG